MRRYFYELHIDGMRKIMYINHAELRLLIHDHIVRSVRKIEQ